MQSASGFDVSDASLNIPSSFRIASASRLREVPACRDVDDRPDKLLRRTLFNCKSTSAGRHARLTRQSASASVYVSMPELYPVQGYPQQLLQSQLLQGYFCSVVCSTTNRCLIISGASVVSAPVSCHLLGLLMAFCTSVPVACQLFASLPMRCDASGLGPKQLEKLEPDNPKTTAPVITSLVYELIVRSFISTTGVFPIGLSDCFLPNIFRRRDRTKIRREQA